MIAARPPHRRSCGSASGGSGYIYGTIPQLLLSGAWAILPLVMNGRTAVFPHRGLPYLDEASSEGSLHQFTPMSGTHNRGAGNSALELSFAIRVSSARDR